VKTRPDRTPETTTEIERRPDPFRHEAVGTIGGHTDNGGMEGILFLVMHGRLSFALFCLDSG